MSIIIDYLVCLMFASLAVIWLCILSAFVLTFFVPKKMLETYFREPYFNAFEVNFFTGPLYSYMRTAMMMRLAGWPESGKKRGIPTTSHELCPVWFQVVSRWQIYISLTSLALCLVTGGLFYLLHKVLGYE